MSLSKLPVAVSSVALLAGLSLVPSAGSARDGQRAGEDAIHELRPMSPRAPEDIIFQMAPLKPVRGAARAAKQAPKPAEQSAPAGVQSPAPVAETQKPAEAPKLEEASQPGQKQAASEEASPSTPSTAQAPAFAAPAQIGAPILTLNGPAEDVAGLKDTIAALDGSGVDIQGGSEAPGFVPSLDSLAQSDPAQAEEPRANAVNAQAPAEAAAPLEMRPGIDAAAENNPETRTSAILAEGLVGPAEVRIADRATLWLPAGRVFLPLEAAKRLAKEVGIESRASLQGMVAPAGGKLEWLASVELLNDGHIQTGEAGALQADQLLAAFQASFPEINAQRARTGAPAVSLEGWLVPPALDAKRRLSACVDISTENDKGGRDRFFNCEAWALARDGAIKVGLADVRESSEALTGEAAALANVIVFDHGKGYEDFDASADKVAPYTVADLLTRDVAAQTPKPAPAPQQRAETPAIIDGLLQPALLALAAIGLYIFLKRRRQQEKVEEAQAAPVAAAAEAQAPASLFARLLPTLHERFAKKAKQASQQAAEEAQAAPVAAETVAAEALAPASLFARLLPTLHKRFAKQNGNVSEPGPVTAGAELEAPEQNPFAALKNRLAGLRNLRKKEPSEASTMSRPVSSAIEEPVSTLKKLAAKMRRTNEEPQPQPVMVSRIARSRRGGAVAVATAVAEPLVAPLAVVQDEGNAPETALLEPELIEPGRVKQTMGKVEESPTPLKTEALPVFDEENLGLVEPGHLEAAAAASAPRDRQRMDV